MAIEQERAAIVTGGALGIGGAIARRLAQDGAHVLIADIDADAAQANVARITAAGDLSRWYQKRRPLTIAQELL